MFPHLVVNGVVSGVNYALIAVGFALGWQSLSLFRVELSRRCVMRRIVQCVIGSALSSVLLFAFLLSLPAASYAQEMKIGASAPLTGPAAYFGTYMKRAVDLAFEEVNAKGGVKGRKLVVVWEDDKGNPAAAVTALKKLVSVDKVPVVMGSLTATSLAMVPAADKEGVVFITSLSTHPEIAKMSKWSFRNCISTVAAGQAVMEVAYKQQGKRKLGVLFQENESPRRETEGARKRFEELGGTVVASETLPEQSVDYRSSLIKIKNANPDGIWIAAFNRPAGLAMKQLVEMGVHVQMYTSPIESDVWIQTAGSAANGVLYGYLDIDKAYLAKYKAKYNEEAEIFGAQYYETAHTLAIAIDKGGYTADGIRKALIEIKNYAGVTGPVTYGPERDVAKPVIVKMVKDGKFVKYQ